MDSFSVLHIPFSPNNRKQTVLIHHSENGFGIVMDSMSFQPDMYSSVTISTSAFSLAFADLLSQRQIFSRDFHPIDIPVVATARHTEKPTHLTDAVLFPVPIDHLVFDDGLHPFLVCERKSRINSFSIFNRLFSDFANLNCRL